MHSTSTPRSGLLFLFLRLALVLVVLGAGLGGASTRAQDFGLDSADIDIDIDLGELEDASAPAAWWNKAWQLRRRVTLQGPSLLSIRGGVVFFDEPDPLLLYNTGRAQTNLADVRVVSAQGKLWPSGVVNFGRDDGSARLWCMPDRAPMGQPLTFYLYYSNPAAQPTGDQYPPGVKAPEKLYLTTTLADEEAAPEAKLPPVQADAFFANTVSAEIEQFEGVETDPRKRDAPIWAQASDQASAEGYVLVARSVDKGSIRTRVQLPSAGTWQVHVRYGIAAANGSQYSPFTLHIAEHSFETGNAPGPAGAFIWQSHACELPAGEVSLELQFEGPCQPDVILLSRDPRYLPDYRDVTGPVWMRFKLVDDPIKPYFVDFFCMDVTYSVNGMQGKTVAYLFGDRAVRPGSEYEQRRLDETSYVQPGRWTPWGEALKRGTFTWFSRIRFLRMEGSREVAVPNRKVAFEFATRNHPDRVYRTGVDEVDSSSLHVHMPARLDLANLRQETLSFWQWAQRRYEIGQSLGFAPNEGPRKLVYGTMTTALSRAEAERIFATCNLIGLNTLNVNTWGLTSITDPVHEQGGIPWTWEFYRTGLAASQYFENANGPLPGLTFGQTVDKLCADGAEKLYSGYQAGRLKREGAAMAGRIAYNDFDDEIGPTVSAQTINEHPLFRGFFHEWLQEQGLTPEFFGVSQWEEVKAVTYEKPSYRREVLLQMQADATAAETDQVLAGVGDRGAELEEDEQFKEFIEEENQQKQEAAARAAEERRQARMHFEKRAYYYTQRFRTFCTAIFYRHHAQAMNRHFGASVPGSVNLQAMPAQIGQMWTGGLDIFELARLKTWNEIQIEDWTGGTVNVHFAAALSRAAGARHNQPPAVLTVGSNPGARTIANLMQGVRYTLFYLYGPIYNIGPVWAEDQATLRDIGQTLRKVARCEEAILASHPRPAGAALLVANASEIGSAYLQYPFQRERLCIWGALLDAQVPVEIVSEQQIREDGALDRYQVLYVAEPHVHRDVQEKIKAWVRAGGTLWSSYAGLARDEFDQTTSLFDEVFGIASRPVEPFIAGGNYGALPTEGVAYHTIRSSGSGTLPAGQTQSLHYKPSYELTTGRALAAFDDASPAIIENQFGQGRAILNGYTAGLGYAHYRWSTYHQAVRSPEASEFERRVITHAAAQLDRDVVIDAPACIASVHEGPEQTVLFLVNDSAQPLQGRSVTVRMRQPVARVYSGTQEQLAFDSVEQGVRIEVDLQPAEGNIYVFVHGTR